MGSGAKSSRPCDGKWFTTPHAETLTYRGAYGHFLRVNKTVRCPFLRGVKMPRMVKCIKLGREAEGLDFPTYPGELGKRIFDNVSKEAWGQWLEHQKMLVNENRLNPADKKAREYLAQQMENHFFGSGADGASRYVPPSPKKAAAPREHAN